QAVRAADKHKKLKPLKGLVNAVLRRYLRERAGVRALALKDPVARYNHPTWWVERLQQAYPDQWQELLAAADRPAPMVLRVNARRARPDRKSTRLNSSHVKISYAVLCLKKK